MAVFKRAGKCRQFCRVVEKDKIGILKNGKEALASWWFYHSSTFDQMVTLSCDNLLYNSNGTVFFGVKF